MKYRFLFVHEGGSFLTEPMTTKAAVKEFGKRRTDRPATEHVFRISGDRMSELEFDYDKKTRTYSFRWELVREQKRTK